MILKGPGSPDGLSFLTCIDTIDRYRPKEASRVVFEFLQGLQAFSIEINKFLPVNANISWLTMLVYPNEHIILRRCLIMMSGQGCPADTVHYFNTYVIKLSDI